MNDDILIFSATFTTISPLRSEDRTSCHNLLSQLVVLANLVVGEHLKVLLEEASQLQQCCIVCPLICPLQSKTQSTSIKEMLTQIARRRLNRANSQCSQDPGFLKARPQSRLGSQARTPESSCKLHSKGFRSGWHQ